MEDQAYAKEKHFVEVFDVKQPVEAVYQRAKTPVEAVCKPVRDVQEGTLSYHGVKAAIVETPSYQPVRRLSGEKPVLQRVRLSAQDGLPVQKAEKVISTDLVFDDVKSKKAGNRLTLQELFSQEEG